MALKLTPEVLAAAYDFMTTTEPFSKWNLPGSDDIKFKAVKDRRLYGWLIASHDKIEICVSSSCVGHTAKLMETMAHEMIHLHQHLTGMPKNHGPTFQQILKHVCKVHGFDPCAF